MKRLFLVVVPIIVLLLAGPAVAEEPMTNDAGQLTSGVEDGPNAACWAEAECSDGTSVTCFGSSSCNAVDSNCTIQRRGYVKCDGSYTYCPICPGCSREGWPCVDASDCRTGEPACAYCVCTSIWYRPAGMCACLI